MSTSGRRARAVAMAGIAALALVAASAAQEPPAQKTAWLRIAVSEKSAVYVQAQGLELRAATSVEGLQSAEPMKMRLFGGTAAQAREFALPIPAGQLPAGVTAVKLGLWLKQEPPGPANPLGLAFSGKLTLCRTDAHKAEWQYVTSIAGPAGGNAENALPVSMASLDDLKLTVTAVPGDGKIGVGVAITAGSAAIPEIRKDGKPVQLSVKVVDAGGELVEQKSGTPADFGFSSEGPRCSVGAAKGTYTCTATMDIGTGVPLKGTAKAVVGNNALPGPGSRVTAPVET